MAFVKDEKGIEVIHWFHQQAKPRSCMSGCGETTVTEATQALGDGGGVPGGGTPGGGVLGDGALGNGALGGGALGGGAQVTHLGLRL
jgi:hypothetical protein